MGVELQASAVAPMEIVYSVDGKPDETVQCVLGSQVVFGRGAHLNRHIDLPNPSASRQAVTVVLSSSGRAKIESGQRGARVIVATDDGADQVARLAEHEGLLLAPGATYRIRLALMEGVALTARFTTPVLPPRPKPATGPQTTVPMRLSVVMGEADTLSWRFVTAFAVAVMRPGALPEHPQKALVSALTCWNGEAPKSATLNRRLKDAVGELKIDLPLGAELVPALAANAVDLGILRPSEVVWLREQLTRAGYIW